MPRWRKVSQVARASHKAEAATSRVVESRSGEGVARGGGAIARRPWCHDLVGIARGGGRSEGARR